MSSLPSMLENGFSMFHNATDTISAFSTIPLPLGGQVAQGKDSVWTSALAVYLSIAWMLWRMTKILQTGRACLVSQFFWPFHTTLTLTARRDSQVYPLCLQDTYGDLFFAVDWVDHSSFPSHANRNLCSIDSCDKVGLFGALSTFFRLLIELLL